MAADNDPAIPESIKLKIQELLDLCAENEVTVPLELKEALLGKPLEGEERGSIQDLLCQEIEQDPHFKQISQIIDTLKATFPDFDLRIQDGSYKVTNYLDDEVEPDTSDGPRRARQKIKTVRTESPVFKLFSLIKRCIKCDIREKTEEKVIMEKVNLALDSSKVYLVLGSPGCGKSTLLKMIADTLHKSKDSVPGGEISINGVTPSKDVIWSNLVSYMDQIDRLHPYLTVYETCEFAWKCRSGGTHRESWYGEGPEIDQQVQEMDTNMTKVKNILEALGLTRVKDTFVGDQKVRGVSGGEKKRVTIAEMLCVGTPVLCCDEISTGLDAATTYDITKGMRMISRIRNLTFVVSLLQPPPETFSNFDDLILLSDGKIIYSGPVDEVINHFSSLGYEIPERMDVADWLQALPTKDGWQYLKQASEGFSKEELMKKHLTTDEFVERFYSSDMGKAILEELEAPANADAEFVKRLATKRYANSWRKSLKLLARRELLLWWRDKYQIKAKLGQTLVMGIVVGTVFWQQTSNGAIIGVLFQSLMFMLIGAMLLVVRQFPERSIYYKHQDANFFPTWAYVAGKSIASIPVATIDGLIYGTFIYWFVGLAYGGGASIAHYFMYICILFVTSLASGLVFSGFAACVSTVTIAQACMAVFLVILVLFSGFTIQPNIIPVYYIWIYWLNYFAWNLRGLAVNEFDSGAYDNPVSNATDITEGEAVLTNFGFTLNGEPYDFIWSVWGLLFTLAWAILAIGATVYFLTHIRFTTGKSLVTDQGDDVEEDTDEADRVQIPFKKVNLTFKDIRYTVKASTSRETLELLKGVDGVVEAGEMTALMGSSGAGKTTLMDVLAMRKSSGVIEGEICLNGHEQEEKTFRRCTGYVEQFDVQTPQLTIRETMRFSAKLRLEESDPVVTNESIEKFVDEILAMLELTNTQDLQVGTDADGGLSFEQKKRLSIAVEVVSNPSILFLDEPTSGLDARAASIVMRGMKRIALSGRAVCATIHQPSIAIFDDFDSLLLLKRGGETVFFGELGENSSNLINYLERYDATPRIKVGENPATWMLTTIGAGSAQTNRRPFDYAGSYAQSKLHADCIEKIDSICLDATEENRVSFPSKYATSKKTQSWEVLKRTMSVYFRSPNYNVVRIMVSAIVALLFSTAYILQRVPETEADMNSRINSIFVAVTFLCVNGINMVLGVFETERNMYYRHKAANMYDSRAIALAFTVAEVPFLIFASVIFMVVFYFIMGFAMDAGKFFFFLFFFLALTIFTYAGQMLVSLVRDAETAQGLSGLFVSMNLLFAGILIRPDKIPIFWIFCYWVFPGHYIFEGIFTTQYDGDDTPIVASVGTPYYRYLQAAGDCNEEGVCVGTAEEWVQVSFVDFSRDHVPYCIGYLVGAVVVTRVITYIALTKLNYRST